MLGLGVVLCFNLSLSYSLHVNLGLVPRFSPVSGRVSIKVRFSLSLGLILSLTLRFNISLSDSYSVGLSYRVKDSVQK